jgi:hypothetical protein
MVASTANIVGAHAARSQPTTAQSVGSAIAAAASPQVTDATRDALAHVDEPLDTSSSRPALDRLSDIRTALADPALDPAARRYLQHEARSIEDLLVAIRRQEEKDRLLEKLMKELAAGALTPRTVRLAKALGLARVLKDLIRQMVAAGKLDDRSMAQVAHVMVQAGLPMPDLESAVIRQQRTRQREIERSREARAHDSSTGAALLPSSPAGLAGIA